MRISLSLLLPLLLPLLLYDIFVYLGDEQNKIARMYFGYKPNKNTKLIQGDGVQVMKDMLKSRGDMCFEMGVEEMSISPSNDDGASSGPHDSNTAAAMDIILIDADSKDSSSKSAESGGASP